MGILYLSFDIRKNYLFFYLNHICTSGQQNNVTLHVSTNRSYRVLASVDSLIIF